MHILAIDLGTSAIKFLRLDMEGRVLSVDRTPAGKLDVPAWMSAIRSNIAAHSDRDHIAAIAVTGQMHGLITRENGETWGEGIPWYDQRSASMIPHLQGRIGQDAISVTGGPLAAGFMAASLAWIRANDRDRWSHISRAYLPKDALILALTGRSVTDPSDAAGTGLFASERRAWAWDILESLRIPRPWLPDIIPSGAVAGPLTLGAAAALGLRKGIPVIISGGDAAAGAWGAGVSHHGDALVLLSSGAQVILPTHVWRPDRQGRWYTWPSVAPSTGEHARFLRVGTVLNGGNVMEWARTALMDASISDHPTGLIALPHLLGTRENPATRGAVLGITPDTSAAELRRALIEGIAFSLRRKLEEMTGAGDSPARIRIGGGLAHAPEYRQLFANVFGTPVERAAGNDLSAYGAALLALETLEGTHPEHAPREIDVPDPDAASTYDGLYRLYCRADDTISPVMADIASLRPEGT